MPLSLSVAALGCLADLINCATNTEVTHETLSVFLPKSKYFRFNPRTENFPLDEIRPERLQRMKRIARSGQRYCTPAC